MIYPLTRQRLVLDSVDDHKTRDELKELDSINASKLPTTTLSMLNGSVRTFQSRPAFSYHQPMRRAGFLLLLAGWGVLVVAIASFSGHVSRFIFVVVGLLFEALGLALVGLDLRHPAGARE